MTKSKMHWSAGVHHDGSALYVSNPLPTLGETVTIRLRVPLDAPVKRVYLRSAPDGEGHLEAMQNSDEDVTSAYWELEMPVSMPYNTYRFKLMTDEGAYYYTAEGISRADTLDFFDFKLLADFDAPSWLEDRIFYQIFPDRFHNGDASINPQSGDWVRDGRPVKFRDWGELPLSWKESGSVDFFGGDLIGIQQKIDYLLDLGVNAVYLNPIFSSHSNHRYDIIDFYTVDRYLGGNDALVVLNRALHGADIRLILDMTPNHSGSGHPWFTDASEDENAETADFYTFYERPDDFLAWLGIKSLPKLNYSSQKLRDRMYQQEDSILRYWMNPPFEIDGWRLDVYNMTARQGTHQLNEEVGREMRQSLKAAHPDSYIFGENFHDGTLSLQGDQLDAVMNYQGFNMPLWRWLNGVDHGAWWRPEFSDTTLYPAEFFVQQLTRYMAAVPWVITRMQFNQLGSHDTPRILNLMGHDKSLVKLGTAMLMTYPGVPCIYYGDEIGMDGAGDPDNRRTMPWDDSQWDTDLLDFNKKLIELRKTQPALLRGGLQHLFADDGLWVFQRQSKEQRLIVVGYRGPEALSAVDIPLWQAGIQDGAELKDLLSDLAVTVKDGEISLSNLQKGQAMLFEVQV